MSTFRHTLRLVRWSGLALSLAFGSAARADQLSDGVPIVLTDELKLARDNELVTVSVPVGETASIYATTQLIVLDEFGVEIPTQWRVLTRWRGVPTNTSRPIKFALAKFNVTLAANQTRAFLLKRRTAAHGPPALPAKPLTLYGYGSWLGVNTGAALFHLSPEQFTLFHDVWVDLDANGLFEDGAGERIVKGGDSLGPLLVDRFGGAYVGMHNAGASFVVEENGPLVTVVRVDGLHQPVQGMTTIGRDFLGYSVRLEFRAGSPAVRVQHILRNSYLSDPLGNIAFSRVLLHLRLNAQSPVFTLFGPDASTTSNVLVNVPSGGEAFLLQDSVGGAYWNQPGTQFSGWRVYAGPHGGLQPESLPGFAHTAAGDKAEGWMDLRDATRGILVALRYPWENYPYALRSYSEGSLVVDLWPAEFQGLHWLDDAQRKTHEMVYVFHTSVGGYNARLEAKRQTNPLLPVVPLAYLRATKAWGDQGDLRSTSLTTSAMKSDADSRLATEYAELESQGWFGWSDFGESVPAKNTHTTGSPRNKLTFFDRFVTSGARSHFILNEMFALHSMDLRTYHIDGFKKEQHPGTYLHEGVPHSSSSDKLGRNSISSTLDPHKVGIPASGHGWNGFDSEHFVVDDLYEYYLLTGSWNAYDALRKIGEAVTTWPFISPTKEFQSSRTIGWTLRGIMKMYAVTGDSRLLDRAKTIVQSVDNFRGKGPSPKTGKTYHWLARQIYGGGSHNMSDDYDVVWQMAVGLYGLALYWRDTGDPQAKYVLSDVSNFMLDYCVQPSGIFKESIDVEDPGIYNPKPTNNGVNTWIASAMAIVYRITGRPEARQRAKDIFDSNPNGYLTGYVSGSDYYHWYHSIGEVVGQ